MKLPRRNFLHLAAGTAALPTASRFAWAQAYPSRPVHLIAPFAPGGAFAWRSTLFSCPIAPNWVRSSSGCGTDDCGRTSATSRPSTMPSSERADQREDDHPRSSVSDTRPSLQHFHQTGQMTEETIIMKAIVVTDQAAGTAGMKLVERPEPQAAINDVVVQVHASGFVPTEMAWPSTWTDRR